MLKLGRLESFFLWFLVKLLLRWLTPLFFVIIQISSLYNKLIRHYWCFMFLILISFHTLFICIVLYCLNFFGSHRQRLELFWLNRRERRSHKSLSLLCSLISCYNGLRIVLRCFHCVSRPVLEVLTGEWMIGKVIRIISQRHIDVIVGLLIVLSFLQTVL